MTLFKDIITKEKLEEVYIKAGLKQLKRNEDTLLRLQQNPKEKCRICGVCGKCKCQSQKEVC